MLRKTQAERGNRRTLLVVRSWLAAAKRVKRGAIREQLRWSRSSQKKIKKARDTCTGHEAAAGGQKQKKRSGSTRKEKRGGSSQCYSSRRGGQDKDKEIQLGMSIPQNTTQKNIK